MTVSLATPTRCYLFVMCPPTLVAATGRAMRWAVQSVDSPAFAGRKLDHVRLAEYAARKRERRHRQQHRRPSEESGDVLQMGRVLEFLPDVGIGESADHVLTI